MNRQKTIRGRQKGQINLSFLDTLSCSLGGMIVLFFIFATLSHDGARTLEEPDTISQAKQEAAKSIGGNPAQNNSPTLHVINLPSDCQLQNRASYNNTAEEIKITKAAYGFLLLVLDPLARENRKVVFEQCPVGKPAQLQAKRANSLGVKSFKTNATVTLIYNGNDWSVSP